MGAILEALCQLYSLKKSLDYPNWYLLNIITFIDTISNVTHSIKKFIPVKISQIYDSS